MNGRCPTCQPSLDYYGPWECPGCGRPWHGQQGAIRDLLDRVGELERRLNEPQELARELSRHLGKRTTTLMAAKPKGDN